MAKLDLSEAAENLDQANIIEQIDEDELKKMGQDLVQGFHNDESSRSEWMRRVEEWLKLAMQVAEKKNYPWPGASNVQYPLLATAALQFQARAYPALVPGPELVSAYVTGVDPDGMSFDRANRVSRHMSYQIMYEMDNWEEEMDKLCLMLPIVGTVFKKTYYDPLKGYNCSHLVSAEDLVINYWTKSIDTSPRISHILNFDRNQIEEKFRAKLWKKIDLDQNPVPYSVMEKKKAEISKMKEPDLDYTTPHTFIEVHTWWDLDDDGYREPWIITIHLNSQQVVRIVPRFDKEGIHTNGKEIVKIEPVQYFTKFGFIPNPDGSDIYDVGFGLLLGNINHSLNTTVNQLLDAGTLNNLQAGFIGRGIRIKGGANRFQPGEWKQADFTGDDIKKSIFPLPTKEPSDVLFKLFEALLTSGKELASIAEIMVGKLPGQNTPATTTQMSVDQSLKIFTAIYKRMYRSLAQEYMKLFDLNKKNMPEVEQRLYAAINVPTPSMNQLAPQQAGAPGQAGPGMEQAPDQAQMMQQMQAMQQQALTIAKSDYEDNILIKPNADPNIASDAQKLTRAQGLTQLLELGTVNVQEATRQILEAGKFERINALLQPNPQRPDPKQIEMQMKMQIEQQKAQMDQQKAAMDLQIEMQKGKMDMAMKQFELMFKEKEMQLKAQEAQMKTHIQMVQGQQDLQMGQMEHQQNMQFSQAEHQNNMSMAHEQHNNDMSMAKEQHTNSMKMEKDKMAMQKEKMSATNKQGRMGGMAGKSGNKGSKGSR